MITNQTKPKLTDFRCGEKELFRVIRNSDNKVINYIWATGAKEAWEAARDGGMTEVRVEPERWHWGKPR